MERELDNDGKELKCAIRESEYQNQFGLMKEPRELREFTSQEIFRMPKGDPRTNIFELGQGAYCFANDENLLQLFEKLESCRRKGIELRFFEKQEYTHESGLKRDHTGIMLDFDIYQKTRDVQWQHREYFGLAQVVIGLISEMIELPAMDIYIIFLRKPAILPVDKPPHGTVYKDGFHMLIPSIQVTKNFKKYLIKRLREGNYIEKAMRNINLITDPIETLDAASFSVPVSFYGCTRPGKPTYTLDFVLKIEYENNSVYNPQHQVTLFNPEIIKSTRKTEKDKLEWKTNVMMEFSLGYELPGGFIKKREFDPKPEFADKIRSFSDRNIGPVIVDEEEQAEIDNDLTIMSMNDPEVIMIKKMIDIIDVRKRLYERKDWINFVRLLANMNPEYKPLAVYGSHRCPEKWVRGGVIELNRLWDEFTSVKPNPGTSPISIRTLHFWAKQDGEEKYINAVRGTAFNILTTATYAYRGVIEHAIVADMLQALFGNKFTCVVDPTSKAATRRIWFEFVLPSDKQKPGEVYKYRQESTPDTLSRYMSAKLPKIYDMVIEFIRGKMTNNDEDVDRNKINKLMLGKLFQSKTNLLKDSFQNSVIKQCEKKFRDYGLYDRLDKCEDIIGVGNGVLKLGRRCELINKFHEYPISMYTETCYIPYHPDNPDIVLLEKAIMDLFPEDEIDAHDYIMYYLASTLDGKPKEGILFLLMGKGGNGKSFLLEMHRAALGTMYGVKLPLSLLTSPRPPAEKPNDALTKLEFAHFTYFSEPDPGMSFYMGPIKEMTGGEAIYIRGLHEKGKYITPHTHYAVAGNHRISIRGNDHGTWRRIKVYNFKITFRDPHEYDPDNPFEKPKDPRFISEVKKDPRYHTAWLSILGHWYEKLQTRYNGRLSSVPHPTIFKETNDYRNEEDTVNKFITSRIVEDKEAADIPLEELCRRYTEWHEKNIKRERFVMSEIREAFKNSALQSSIVMRMKNDFLIGHRIRDLNNITPCEDLNLNEFASDSESKGKEPLDDDDLENLTSYLS